MRKLLLATAALSLSGCSFLGMGGSTYHHNSYAAPAANAPAPCASQACMARWNLEGGVGPAFIVGGDAVTGSQTNDGSGADIRNIDMNDAYDTGVRGELGLSYAVSPNTKVTAMGFIEEADSAGTLDWGTVDGERLTGALSDYESYGAELGLRHYFQPRSGTLFHSVRPYIEGRVGIADVDDIVIENVQLGGDQFGTGRVAFNEGGVVGTAAGLVGVETPLTRYSTIALETGLRYSGALDSDNSDLSAGSPLAGINNGTEKLTIPVMLRGRYRF